MTDIMEWLLEHAWENLTIIRRKEPDGRIAFWWKIPGLGGSNSNGTLTETEFNELMQTGAFREYAVDTAYVLTDAEVVKKKGRRDQIQRLRQQIEKLEKEEQDNA